MLGSRLGLKQWRFGGPEYTGRQHCNLLAAYTAMCFARRCPTSVAELRVLAALSRHDLTHGRVVEVSMGEHCALRTVVDLINNSRARDGMCFRRDRRVAGLPQAELQRHCLTSPGGVMVLAAVGHCVCLGFARLVLYDPGDASSGNPDGPHPLSEETLAKVLDPAVYLAYDVYMEGM